MKRAFITVLAILVAAAAFAQKDSSSVEQKVKHHQFEVRYGAGIFFYAFSEQLDASYGWRFNKKYFLGMGSGIHWTELVNDADPTKNRGVVNSIPLYVDFKRYFPLGRKKIHSFYMGVDLGPSFFLSTPFADENGSASLVTCLFAFKYGFDISIAQKFSIMVGFNLRFEETAFLGINLGVSF